MNLVTYFTLAAAIGVILVLAVMLLKNKQVLNSLRAAEQTAQKIIGDSKREAETIKREAQLEAKDRTLSLRAEVEKQSKDRSLELHSLEQRVGQREELLEKKSKL
jgi:ribonuclease Y